LESDKKNEVIKRAFSLACKFLREHPPEDTCEHIELVRLVYDGKSDPQGVRWAGYFVQQALDEMEE
jgi:hypothetical protein